MSTAAQTLTLEEFLSLPETKPASEFINGQVIQKPMPQGEHSRLQGKLCEAINQVGEAAKIAYAFPELRCSFGGQSVVPDIAVFRWDRILRKPSGRIENRFTIYPDWSIEILSPEQSQTRVLINLLHCVRHGTELGWLIDPDEATVLVVWPDHPLEILRGESTLPVIEDLNLSLTANQLFDWLML
jgi:Uma2 family endonuclease